jgi:hypothetical protein
MSETRDPQIAALLREREGYVRYGKKSRVKDVDAELKRLGHEPTKAEPKKRAVAEKSTADDSPKSSA